MKKINKVALSFGTAQLVLAAGPFVVLYMYIPRLYAITGITFVMVSMVCMGLGVTVLALCIARSIFKDLYNTNLGNQL